MLGYGYHILPAGRLNENNCRSLTDRMIQSRSFGPVDVSYTSGETLGRHTTHRFPERGYQRAIDSPFPLVIIEGHQAVGEW